MSDFAHGTGAGTRGLPSSVESLLDAAEYDYIIQGGGESIYPKYLAATSTAQASQELVLAGFVAKTTEPITQVQVCTGGTAAAATPSICRLGVYRRETNGDLTLLVATANDTTLFSAANTVYAKAFTTTFYKQAGTEYMVGLLIVSAVARPTFHSPATGWPTGFLSASGSLRRPAFCAKVTAQADLGALNSTIANASVAASAYTFHAFLLP